MLHPATIERAGELGLQPFPFYYLGRCGVLGDVDPELVAPVIALFPPAFVAKSWRKGRAVLTPQEAAQAYAECRWAGGGPTWPRRTDAIASANSPSAS